MSEQRYPNETKEYREARDALLKDEQELIDKVKSVAAQRRTLPPGGRLKQDYVFQWANDGKVGTRVKFSELFGSKNTLLLYSWMFGPNWDHPCPSCTSLMDGFDRAWYSVSRDAAFAGIAKAAAEKRVGQGAQLVAHSALVWLRVIVPEGLQVPGRDRRQAHGGDAGVQEAGRQDRPVLEQRRLRRHGVAVLEPHGPHAGRPAGPADPAASVHARVFREALPEQVACRASPIDTAATPNV